MQFGTIAVVLSLTWTSVQSDTREQLCQKREFRCLLRCNEVTKPGSQGQLDCYQRCYERRYRCVTEGP